MAKSVTKQLLIYHSSDLNKVGQIQRQNSSQITIQLFD